MAEELGFPLILVQKERKIMQVFAIPIARIIILESDLFVGKIVQLDLKMMELSVKSQPHMVEVLDGFLKMSAKTNSILNVKKMDCFGIQFVGRVSTLLVAVSVLLTV
jgi:hypothetical protein